MAKSTTKRRRSAVSRTFKKAWRLLGRLENRLQRARNDEAKRARQLGDATGKEAAKRSLQLGAAQAEVAEVEGLLTELSELIASDAQAQAGQVVKDVAHEAAGAVREAASAGPTKTRPVRRPAAAKPTAKPATKTAAVKPTAKPATPPSTPSGPEPTTDA